MIGRRVNGMFEEITHLERCPGYDADLLGIESYAHETATAQWQSSGVVAGKIKPSVDAPGKIAQLDVELGFRNRDDALLLLRGMQHHHYSDTRNLKHLLHDLREVGEWEEDYCVITEVIEANAAWVFCATDVEQSASLSASVSALPAALPASLQELVGDAALDASIGCANFRGFFTKLPNGGTPLFSALKFSREWWQLGLGKPHGAALKGADNVFEEASFGD